MIEALTSAVSGAWIGLFENVAGEASAGRTHEREVGLAFVVVSDSGG
jgi:hypothetical protein